MIAALPPGWRWLVPDSFKEPLHLMLIAAAVLGVVLYVVALRLRGRRAMRFTNTAVLGKVAPPQRRWLRHLAVAFSLLSLVTLAFAWATPYANDKVPRERATVVVVLDVSQSMSATDVQPTRIAAAKAAAKTFVGELPEGYNVAVVSLSGNPAQRIPPTRDHAAAQRTIDTLELQDSTAIGEAIYTALDSVAQAPKGDNGSAAPAAIVLLSDGQNTAGRPPVQAADAAAKAKVPVYTVSYGTANGYVDLDGKRNPVPPDPQLMSDIAKVTGGKFYQAKDAGQLSEAYKSLKGEVGYEVVETEVTASWAGAGLAFAALAAIAAIMMAARWP